MIALLEKKTRQRLFPIRGSGTSILDTTYYNDSDSDELPLFADKGDSGILAEESNAPTYNGKVISCIAIIIKNEVYSMQFHSMKFIQF